MIHEIEAIIDRSGSMQDKEQDIINGINIIINTFKKNNDNFIIKFSLKFFDHEEKIAVQSIDIDNVELLKKQDLIPRGKTAILDAIGNSINYFLTKKKENADAFHKCIIYVSTDGIDNASKKYNNEKIQILIKEAKQNNIEILYLASNQDAILESSKFGLNSGNALNYLENPNNIKAAYLSASNAGQRFITGKNIHFLDIERNLSTN
tara:strand:- start:9846 stop:10466 length:621 start_codon:yes stop_codon:yes gene_type:complete